MNARITASAPAGEAEIVASGQRTELDAIHFFCVLIPRRVSEQVGELDERFGLELFEDDDYSMRVRRAGVQVA